LRCRNNRSRIEKFIEEREYMELIGLISARLTWVSRRHSARASSGTFDHAGRSSEMNTIHSVRTRQAVSTLVLLVLITACGKTPVQTEPAAANSSAAATSQSGQSETTPQSAQATASSAAAAAPECKDMEKADNNTCNPAATGDPHSK